MLSTKSPNQSRILTRIAVHLPLEVSIQNSTLPMRTSFMLSDSRDIDMVVEWQGNFFNKPEMKKLARHIEKSGVGKNFQYILNAKVCHKGITNVGSYCEICRHVCRDRY
jgi:hypothetical protein